MLRKQGFNIICLLFLQIFFSGCSYLIPENLMHRNDGVRSSDNVDWFENSEVHRDLLALPLPTEKMTVSVYNFRDQSGQYLPQPANAFSTAVPQGTLPMLVSALRQSGWFELVEREGLQNLLTERKILRAKQDEQGDQRPIKALSAADVIIEGGILAYDTNIRTGGGGAKYIGVGSSGQYREDQVTIGLRAVDVNSGRIFNSVSVTKRLLSTQVAGNIFRFVRYKKLLEVEGGYTETDPAQVVVMDAIEAGVIKLILSGVIYDHWGLKYDQDENHPLMQKYNEPVKYASWKEDRFKQRLTSKSSSPRQPKVIPSTTVLTKANIGSSVTSKRGAHAGQDNSKKEQSPANRGPILRGPNLRGANNDNNGGDNGQASYASTKSNGGSSNAQYQNKNGDNPKLKTKGVSSSNQARATNKAPVTKAPVTKAPITKAPITKAPVTKAPALGYQAGAKSQDSISTQPADTKPNIAAHHSSRHQSPTPQSTIISEPSNKYFSPKNSAKLNNKMKAAATIANNKKRTQSMTLNRARSQNAPRPKSDSYTIQLYAGQTDNALIQFLDEYPSLSGQVWQTQQSYLGKVWYTVVYGRFQHEYEASLAMKELPLHIRDLSPWVRAIITAAQ